jgi:hypothetical protein
MPKVRLRRLAPLTDDALFGSKVDLGLYPLPFFISQGNY